jgi:oligopeptide/dipeptide ABC transporter ATP-binding protein
MAAAALEAPVRTEYGRDDAPILTVTGLTTKFRTVGGTLTAVNDVSFSLRRGEILAVLGESGSGKSAMLKSMLGIQPASAEVSGRAVLDGVDLLGISRKEQEKLRGSKLSMVFQDPMTALDPLYTVEQQITETIRRHTSLSRREAAQRALELLNQVQIPSPERRLKAYPFELSGGMRQRVVIAMALACGPRLLLADEPTTALDVTVQARVLRLLRDLRDQLQMSVILVTHDLAAAAQVADRVAVMYAGRLVEQGTVRQIVADPRHPYTRGLLAANVRPGQKQRPGAIPGAPPSLANLPPGCSFAPRCAAASAACWERLPELRSLDESHALRCVNAA